MVNEGDPAPDFELLDQEGRPVRLSALQGQPVVLYFYPADFTRGCTAQACGFRDQAPAFDALGAHVLGVSHDRVATHLRFARENALPFRLLSDPRGDVHRAYGVSKTFGVLPQRITFVIGPDGRILRRIRSATNMTKHVESSLRALRAAALSDKPPIVPL